MVFKRMLKHRIINSDIRTSAAGRWIKRVALAAVIIGLVFVIGAAALIGFAVSKVSNMMSARPDTDLAALQQLIADKTIVLSTEQKAALTPLLKELAASAENSAQAGTIKEKIWNTLAPEQAKAAREWQSLMEKKAGSIVETSTVPLLEAISKYTGIPAEQLQQPIESLSAWWQLKTQQNASAQELLNQVNTNN